MANVGKFGMGKKVSTRGGSPVFCSSLVGTFSYHYFMSHVYNVFFPNWLGKSFTTYLNTFCPDVLPTGTVTHGLADSSLVAVH